MKQERLFEAKGRRLFRMDGTEVPAGTVAAKPVALSAVAAAPESYNEDFLASLRNELKALEGTGAFVFIEPVFDADFGWEDAVAAFKHTARRIKDCAAVAGFAVPAPLVPHADSFIAELSAKHQHYCFFCKEALSDSIVLY